MSRSFVLSPSVEPFVWSLPIGSPGDLHRLVGLPVDQVVDCRLLNPSMDPFSGWGLHPTHVQSTKYVPLSTQNLAALRLQRWQPNWRLLCHARVFLCA